MSSRSRNHDLKRKSHPHSNCSLKKRRRRSKKLRKSKGSSSTNEIITQKLFRVTQEYHRNCLRKLFLKYYEPSVINGTLEINKQWTRDVGKNVLDHLRLHLTWVLKGEVFHWTDEQIGKKTLIMFSDFGKISSNMFITRACYMVTAWCRSPCEHLTNRGTIPDKIMYIFMSFSQHVWFTCDLKECVRDLRG